MIHLPARSAVPVAVLAALTCAADSAPAQTLEVAATVTPPAGADCGVCLEGPAGDAAGDVYFTDLLADKILKLGIDGSVTTFRHPANNPNGLVFDAGLRLIAAERGDADKKTPARLTRTDMASGRIEVLAEQYAGKSFGMPNDLTFDGRGRIYFTAGGNVYRLDLDGKVTQLAAAPVVSGSNGIMVSPDDSRLYVVEVSRGAAGPRRIQVFDLNADGAVANPRVFHDFFPGRGGDGMAVDVEGNVYVAAGMNKPRGSSETLDVKAGVYVFSPSGSQIRMVPIPQDIVTNVGFGGTDLKTLYVTAGSTLYKIANSIAGTRR